MAIVTQNGIAYQGESNKSLLLGPKKEALERLASIDLIELCHEAKVEHCRATRDLRSCGRLVQYVLTSCGHASLCAECSQRHDSCPICRKLLPPNGNRIQLRLYYECIEAGLISNVHEDRFQENEVGENHLAADVQRLYALFDVAMENNLVSLICHYITDVCMDESAVSSDPVVSFLLDEVVIKDWCKRAFGNIQAELRRIYSLELEDMKTSMSSLLRFSSHLTGIASVLDVLESSIKGTISAQRDLHFLQDNVLKAKQHLEVMTWCIRHQFVVDVRSRYASYESWGLLFRERKSAAVKRSWPDLMTNASADSTQLNGATLFIEDALMNLEIEQELEQENEVVSSKIKGFAGCYPFENMRSATDILFLHGSSDMVVAKEAIFLYYLFDRHWTIPDAEWRSVIDDFAATFGLNRHAVLESLIFYLLDDHTDQALQEACNLLPEIAGPATHPKIAQVLLERQSPDAALMVLRWSGLDGLSAYSNSEHGKPQLVSLREAVIAVRARLECGLLTEAFMYQRTHHTKAKEEISTRGENRMEALVTEICILCIRRNLVDRMIELPWNCDEEKFIHKCLFDYATEDPSAPFGSLLVVYYLQRFRYNEAYQIDRKLQSLEKDFISRNPSNEELVLRITSAAQKRVTLVDKCVELLPMTEQHQVKTGNLDTPSPSSTQVEAQLPSSSSPLLLGPLPAQIHSSILAPRFDPPRAVGGYNIISNSFSEPRRKFPTPVKATTPSFHKQFGDPRTPGIGKHLFSQSKLGQESDRSSSRVFPSNHLTPARESNLGFGKISMDLEDTPRNDGRFSVNSIRDVDLAFSGKQVPAGGLVNDSMDYSWSFRNGDLGVEGLKVNGGGMRWRSDEDEEEASPEMNIGGSPMVRSRRRRPVRR
ncbi:RING-type E3 ubiquitin transferase [Ranunculus cassubicifolius]